jgi:D-alanine-D-alanine ligase
LIEEFIVGREFTALVVEPQDARQAPQALEPLEFVFPQGQSFRHFDIKWIDYSKIQLKTVDNLNLNQRIRQLSSHTFLALGLEGYARCDIRMDENGELFFLEINANPSMFYPEDSYGCSDVILLNDPMGHRGFIERIVAAALRRHESNQKSWRVDFDPQRGFGLYANRPIAINELVLQYELQPVTLASRSYIEKNWRGPLLQWFDIYAYPISERVSAVWDNKPEDWRPINHSCNPNLWLDGLDCVARYPIATGEELTLDYATFCGPGMAEFDCACGAVECRGVIRGTDCYLTELIQRYGNRVTDYVQFERSKVVHPGDVPYEIRPTPYGVGLFALRIWKINQKIANLRWGTTHDKPTRWTIQRDTTKHAEPIPHELRYINHGCDPNVFFDVERRQIIALVDIRIGDELKFFYPSTEWRLQEPFDCVCGSPRCLGAISGANGIANSILTRYRLAEHIQQLALTQSN